MRHANKERATVRGIGFLGYGPHEASLNGKNTRVYQIWGKMFTRCYCPKFLNSNPTYRDCVVHEDWHNFQNFAEWYKQQEFRDDGYCLDKDVLFKGNKVYGPDTCCLIPQEVNKLIAVSKIKSSDLPTGVVLRSCGIKFQATVTCFGRVNYAGTFETADEAHLAYKTLKQKYVKDMAELWKGRISKDVYEALMKWSF